MGGEGLRVSKYSMMRLPQCIWIIYMRGIDTMMCRSFVVDTERGATDLGWARGPGGGNQCMFMAVN